MRRSIRRLLANDYEVLEAADGEEGIRLLHQNKVDLAITDIFMPDKDGILTIKDIRHNFPDVKIIAMSGGGSIGSTNSLHVAKVLGAEEVFSKPFEPEELLSTIQEMLK